MNSISVNIYDLSSLKIGLVQSNLINSLAQLSAAFKESTQNYDDASLRFHNQSTRGRRHAETCLTGGRCKFDAFEQLLSEKGSKTTQNQKYI